jgi:hypothetical protein
MDEILEGWEEFYSDNSPNFLASRDGIKVTKSKSIMCAGHVARMR